MPGCRANRFANGTGIDLVEFTATALSLIDHILRRQRTAIGDFAAGALLFAMNRTSLDQSTR